MSGDRAWNVVDLLKWTTDFFEKKKLENPRLQADTLLGHVLDLDRLKLYLEFEYRPTPAELKIYRELVRRRGDGEPLQYLTGTVRFCGMNLDCDRRALIPRPETEILAARLDKLLGDDPASLADVGTGSGCLALALAGENREVWATDLSPAALALAAQNAAKEKIEPRFLEGNLLEALETPGGPARESLDLLVSNPPYIGEDERASLQPEVVNWEPNSALFWGPDGLGALQTLLEGAPAWLRPGGHLVMEMAPRHASPLLERARSGPWEEAWVEKDDQDKDRYFFARKRNGA